MSLASSTPACSLRRILLVAGACALPSCATDFDSARRAEPRRTIGEEVFGVACDRVGAQALREDLTGASYRSICHEQNGAYGDKVDTRLLPPIEAPSRSSPASEARRAAVARVEAIGRRRAELIAAINSIFPDAEAPVKHIRSIDGAGTGTARSEPRLLAVGDLLDRMADLYNEGTIPDATRATAGLLSAIEGDAGALAALSRMDARQGYARAGSGASALQRVLGYPRIRDASFDLVRLFSADADPYDNAMAGAPGRPHVVVPGSARPAFEAWLRVAHEELRRMAVDPAAGSAPVKESGLPRPLTAPELLGEALLHEDASFGDGSPIYVVRRDRRGLAIVAPRAGALPPPFVDNDGDGLADIDATGRFVTRNGKAAPAPFPVPGEPSGVPRDAAGRALAADGLPLFETIDARRTLAAWLLRALPSLLDIDRETPGALTLLFDALPPLLGGRAESTKAYPAPDDSRGREPGVAVAFNGFQADRAAAVDLAYAIGQIAADPSTDSALLLARDLAADHPALLARLVGTMSTLKSVYDRHPEAQIPAKSTLWDELYDQAVEAAKVPGLLEDVLRALGDDDSVGLRVALPKYLRFADRIGYDPDNLNGPPFNFTTGGHDEPRTPVNRDRPNTGFNRSVFQRFLSLVHDADGIASCSKAGAILHARILDEGEWADVDVPVEGAPPEPECSFNKVDNLAMFYLDAMVGKAPLRIRRPFLAEMLTPDAIEASTGISKAFLWPREEGIWPRAEYLSRVVFFDLAHDSVNEEGKNHRTWRFLNDLFGGQFGTRVCEERAVPDPAASGSSDDFDKSDVAPGGLVRGLRSCAAGQWLHQRDAETIFALEQSGGLKALSPLVAAFAKHDREDLLLSTLEVLHRHWQDDTGTKDECDPEDKTGARTCTQDGLNHSELLLAEALESDALPALHELVTTLSGMRFGRCLTVDPSTQSCLAFEHDGIDVMAEAARSMIDPARAASVGLHDRRGGVTAARNDGTVYAQVTPILLLRDALRALDSARDADPARRSAWLEARSILVDRFLTVRGEGSEWTFEDPAVPAALTRILDVTREELRAHCPAVLTPPFAPCRWAREELPGEVRDAIASPVFATTYDVIDALRRDERAWTHLQDLARFALDPSAGEPHDALLATLAGGVQALRNERDIVPVLRALAPAAALDSSGKDKALVDSMLALLGRLAGRAFDPQGTELYAREADPNDVFPDLLARLVTPMHWAAADLSPDPFERAPIEAFASAIAEVNRAAPEEEGPLLPDDIRRILGETIDFLTNRERGLEQLHAIVKSSSGAQ